MNTNKKLNMTMLCDFYELTMGNGYFKAGYKDRITHFDLFFRNVPDKGGYAIAAGLEQVIEYIQDLHFDPQDIAYLQGRNLFVVGDAKQSIYRFRGADVSVFRQVRDAIGKTGGNNIVMDDNIPWP